ncbi:MAG: family 43 glycosylhydrolase, partial [Fimbriimonadaceae bacterium]
VAFGDSLLGPFRDDTILVPGAEANPGDDQNGAIDPNLYVEDGVPYLLYIREGTPRQLRIVQLAEDLASTVGETTVLLTTDREIERGVLDAPTLIKRDGKYWLFYSSGWFQSYKRDASYRVYVAVSDELNGPYVKSEEPLLTTVPDQVYLPGHQHIFELPSGEWWIAYHAWNAENEPLYGQNEQGRTLRLDRLEWTEDGPVVTGPTLDPITRPKLR